MKVVKFENGKYGIKKLFLGLFPEYRDLKSNSEFWWEKGDNYFVDCQGTKEQVDNFIQIYYCGKL